MSIPSKLLLLPLSTPHQTEQVISDVLELGEALNQDYTVLSHLHTAFTYPVNWSRALSRRLCMSSNLTLSTFGHGVWQSTGVRSSNSFITTSSLWRSSGFILHHGNLSNKYHNNMYWNRITKCHLENRDGKLLSLSANAVLLKEIQVL